jgi:HD-like signal output (HDOD) protein/ActR/RegA family two-component response regulator
MQGSPSRVHTILFVDDDELILKTLQRQLRAYTDRWNATYVGSGEEALELLATRQFDILCTDMVMPGIDGAVLLRHVKTHHPSTLRVVLSGHNELRQVMRSVPFAHQRLLKPWDRQGLVGMLESASRLLHVVGDDTIRKSLSGIDALPSAPATYAKLASLIDNPNASLGAIADLIESDMAMSAKVLQLANSALVASGRKVSNVQDAVRMLGLLAIREYVLNPFLQVFEVFAAGQAGPDRFGKLARHAALTAHIARKIAPSDSIRHLAFLTGLMHDIGRLILLSKLPELAAEIEREAEQKDCSVEDVELRRLGVTHAEIGGYLLGLWGIPPEICRAVSHHHTRNTDLERDPLTETLSAANWLANEVAARIARNIKDPQTYVTDLDEAALTPFGGRARLPSLIALAESCVLDAARDRTLSVPPQRLSAPAPR